MVGHHRHYSLWHIYIYLSIAIVTTADHEDHMGLKFVHSIRYYSDFPICQILALICNEFVVSFHFNFNIGYFICIFLFCFHYIVCCLFFYFWLFSIVRTLSVIFSTMSNSFFKNYSFFIIIFFNCFSCIYIALMVKPTFVLWKVTFSLHDIFTNKDHFYMM